jgi:hypothetical protein
MHVTTVINAIKKCGHLEDYKKAAWAHEKAKKVVESARAGLALLEEAGENVKKLSKKKTKEGKTEAPAKAPEPKSAAKEAEVAPAANDDMKANFSSDLEKAKQAQRIAKFR